MRAQISVGIINYNTVNDLRVCLESLGQSEIPICVFDNASSDGSPDMVAAQFPWVSLHRSSQNLGFGKAANQLIRSAETEYVMLLNSDTRLDTTAVTALAEYLDQHSNVALAGPRLTNSDGTLQPSCFPFPGTMQWLIDNDASSSVVRGVPGLRDWLFRSWRHDCERTVPWVKGAAMAIRRVAFEQIGGFDESFFMYFEETDLCYRLKQNGWEVRFTPAATVIHAGAASTEQCLADMLGHLFAGNLRFYEKHYSVARRAILSYLWRGIILGRFVIGRMKLVSAKPEKAVRIRQQLSAWHRILQVSQWYDPATFMTRVTKLQEPVVGTRAR